MTSQLFTHQKSAQKSSFTSPASRLLQRKCACGASAGLTGLCSECQSNRLTGDRTPLVQTKLTVSQPGDKYEQEADRIADAVMHMPDPTGSRRTSAICRARDDSVQRTKSAAGQIPDVTPALASRIISLRGGGQPLSKSDRDFLEPRFGYDFRHVRIHSDRQAEELARSVNARAFTVGRDIVFGLGQYSPGVIAGRHLLAHELTHTLQQGQIAGRGERAAQVPGIEDVQDVSRAGRQMPSDVLAAPQFLPNRALKSPCPTESLIGEVTQPSPLLQRQSTETQTRGSRDSRGMQPGINEPGRMAFEKDSKGRRIITRRILFDQMRKAYHWYLRATSRYSTEEVVFPIMSHLDTDFYAISQAEESKNWTFVWQEEEFSAEEVNYIGVGLGFKHFHLFFPEAASRPAYIVLWNLRYLDISKPGEHYWAEFGANAYPSISLEDFILDPKSTSTA